MLSCSTYHEATYDPRKLKGRIRRMARKLKTLEKKLGFDALAFRGTSGASLAYPLSVIEGYHLICVRKEKPMQHHGDPVEASESRCIKKYIIVDDFVCSGKTVQSIVGLINKQYRLDVTEPPECVGVLIDHDYSDWGKSRGVKISNTQQIPVFVSPKR